MGLPEEGGDLSYMQTDSVGPRPDQILRSTVPAVRTLRATESLKRPPAYMEMNKNMKGIKGKEVNVKIAHLSGPDFFYIRFNHKMPSKESLNYSIFNPV